MQIINVGAVLVCFLIVSNFIRPIWYELFEVVGVTNTSGEIVISPAGLVNETTIKSKTLKVREHIDTSLLVIPVLILAYLVNSLLNYFFWQGALLDEEGKTMVPKLLMQLSAILIYLIALIIIVATQYPQILSQFLASVGVSGSVAAFLGQQPVKQAFTALSLNINKQVRKGDYIQLGDYTGTVDEIGWKSIRLTTMENNLLILPNIILVNSIYTNFTRNKQRYLDIEVLVNANVQPKRVNSLLRRSALDSPLVIGEPIISLVDIKEFRARYIVRVLTEHGFDNDVRSSVLSSVWYMLRRENIHPDFKDSKIDNPIERAKELLNNVEILAPFNKEDDAHIAQHAEWLFYGPPERVVIEGETDAFLYIIAQGNLEVSIKQKNGENDLVVATLGKNTIFGEMALLTGEPRKATVRAIDDVLLCRISKETIKPILLARPEILEELSEKLAERQMENQRKSAEHSIELESKQKHTITNKLLSLMKNFFKEEEETKGKIEAI